MKWRASLLVVFFSLVVNSWAYQNVNRLNSVSKSSNHEPGAGASLQASRLKRRWMSRNQKRAGRPRNRADRFRDQGGPKLSLVHAASTMWNSSTRHDGIESAALRYVDSLPSHATRSATGWANSQQHGHMPPRQPPIPPQRCVLVVMNKWGRGSEPHPLLLPDSEPRGRPDGRFADVLLGPQSDSTNLCRACSSSRCCSASRAILTLTVARPSAS